VRISLHFGVKLHLFTVTVFAELTKLIVFCEVKFYLHILFIIERQK